MYFRNEQLSESLRKSEAVKIELSTANTENQEKIVQLSEEVEALRQVSVMTEQTKSTLQESGELILMCFVISQNRGDTYLHILVLDNTYQYFINVKNMGINFIVARFLCKKGILINIHKK